jgi:hypothetical protein
MEVSGRLHAPAALPPGKQPPEPIGKEGGPQSRSGRCEEEKALAPAGNQTPAIQPVVRRYTDWAIPALAFNVKIETIYRLKRSSSAIMNKSVAANVTMHVAYCHVLSDYRRGIGLTTGFIGSTLTTRGYTLQFPVTHTH